MNLRTSAVENGSGDDPPRRLPDEGKENSIKLSLDKHKQKNIKEEVFSIVM